MTIETQISEMEKLHIGIKDGDIASKLMYQSRWNK